MMTATTTNLKTQIQSRINNANSTTPKETLLELRKAAEGLKCDETNLDNLMTAINNAFNTAASNEDLLIARVASGVKTDSVGATVLKSQLITASFNFIVPASIASEYLFVSGCAGGGSGARANTMPGNCAGGGWGGTFVVNKAVKVTPNQSIPVVIGAGGLGLTTQGNGNSGGDSSFGNSISLKGGSGGLYSSSSLPLFSSFNGFGINPLLLSVEVNNKIAILAASVDGFSAGTSTLYSDGASGFITGGACGLFGSGTNFSAAQNAPANSGAGSGASFNANTGNGGSGAFLVSWEEFL